MKSRVHVGDDQAAGRQQPTGRLKWYGGAAVALIYLLISMIQAAVSDGPIAHIVAFEVLACAFAGCYLLVPPRASTGLFHPASTRPELVRTWAGLAVMVVLTIPMIAIGGTGVTGLWIYVGAAGAAMLRPRSAIVVAGVLAVSMLVVVAAVDDDGSGRDLAWGALPWEMAVTLVAISLWMVGFAGNIRATVQLRAAQHALAQAAVTAERERIGRDLHDILGHSLTAIAVKTALAGRLLETDAATVGAGQSARAEAEIRDIERLARDALADVRATASGYRDLSLAGEIAVARSVLQAADISADLPGTVDEVCTLGREVFGYVLREAVTNVVRHSGARHCRVVLTDRSIEVFDDGRAAAADPGPSLGAGQGLAGLAERLDAVGGRLHAGPQPGGGFRVLAQLPVDEDGDSDE